MLYAIDHLKTCIICFSFPGVFYILSVPCSSRAGSVILSSTKMMYRLLPALLVYTFFQQALFILRDKDSQCRYRLHYPGASWYSAYDVCSKENKTLARISSIIELQLIDFVFINVKNLLDGTGPTIKHETDGAWIEGFLRSSNNESMQQNCQGFHSEIPIKVTQTGEEDIFCLYYNVTDKSLYTDNCENPRPFLCESLTNDLEDCSLSSNMSILKDNKPFRIASDTTYSDKAQQDCSGLCFSRDKCYAFLYAYTDCKLYGYFDNYDGLMDERSPPSILEHKAIFVYIDGQYPLSVPKPLNDWCPELTEEVIQEKIDNIQKNLTVNKKETNQYIRSLTSAPDQRQSAKNIGIVGVTVISVVFGLVILSDCINLIRAIQNKCKGNNDS